ncbi:kinase-like domain-containing protein [Suillus clintonianus]|uniref:kinase-like domain-containing protein n=1 Tax=Suillus clintonianus TaxID=1904413 RepID=UPI001B875570|nr:kinase-like domain-containing protein [Suillus clintonianus]KAG2156412.1 kinase-like domain-containing protein [Suillus clintonianus]
MYSEVISASQAFWTSTLKGNMRWIAPELLEDREDGSQVRPSEQSDMYSFGGIMLQVLTNKTPYYYLSNDAAIILCIARSEKPSRSRYPVLPEKYWEFIEKCWSTDPRDRPSTEAADGMIRNEFHSLSRAPENPDLAGLCDLTRYITKDEECTAATGGFGEIWKCTYKKDGTLIKRIRRELTICANMKHKNILPVCGYTSGFSPFMAIVSPWVENGDLTTYLKCQGKTLAVVRRFQILNDIIAGLQYLHDNYVIHGDFSGNNVLIDGDGTACITDFGLSSMYSEDISASRASWTSTAIRGTVRWLAPELIEDKMDGSEVRPSQESDIYSFGGIMLQVLTNEAPYYYTKHQYTIILWIAQSKKPDRTRYPDVPDTYWRIIERCWSTVPQDRPSTKQIEIEIRNEFSSLLNLADS